MWLKRSIIKAYAKKIARIGTIESELLRGQIEVVTFEMREQWKNKIGRRNIERKFVPVG